MNVNPEILVAVIGGLLTVAGLFLAPISRVLEHRESRRLLAIQLQKVMQERRPPGVMTAFELQRFQPPMAAPKPQPKGFIVLIVFLAVVLIFGILTGIRYWSYFSGHADKIIFAAWLALAMIFGMFAQVLNSHLRGKQPLSELRATQLLLPLLFSLLVFYPIWGTVGAASATFFSFYAAFLNGFFWETAVAQAHPPKPGGVTP